MGLLRREEKVDSRTRRLKEIQAAIARKKEARQFVIQEKQRVSAGHKAHSYGGLELRAERVSQSFRAGRIFDRRVLL